MSLTCLHPFRKKNVQKYDKSLRNCFDSCGKFFSESEDSSVASRGPMFPGNGSHSSACPDWSHSLKPLNASLYCFSNV